MDAVGFSILAFCLAAVAAALLLVVSPPVALGILARGAFTALVLAKQED